MYQQTIKLNTMLSTKIQIKKNTQETRNLLGQLIRQNIPVGFTGYVLYSQFNKVYSTDVSDWRKYETESLDIQVCATIQGWNNE